MRMRTFLVVAVAVAISGAAFAKDLKGTVMTDAEMDKVTAGEVVCTNPSSVGCGLATADTHTNGVLETKTPLSPGINIPPPPAGLGTTTAGYVKSH
jgi:hypothetical protein